MKKELEKKIINIIAGLITISLILFIIYAFRLGILNDRNTLVEYMKKFGIWAPLIFILLQTGQVVFPVIPGGASCLAGVLAFGPVYGFIYNYIGLVLGSCIAFLLARNYGIKIVEKLFPQKIMDKYFHYIDTPKFEKIFFYTIFLPGLPDDIMCYIAGLSKIQKSTFLLIILLGKPPALLFYSFFVLLI